MLRRKTIVVTIDALPTYLLGAYGADNSLTPHLDTLAAHGLVLDRLYAETHGSQAGLRSLMSGKHFISPDCPISTAAFKTAEFVTDCASAATLAGEFGFATATLAQSSEITAPCEDALQAAALAPWIATAEAIGETFSATSEIDLLWIHSKGLLAPWDAPTELRGRFTDPEDPDPPCEVQPPEFSVDEDSDPDLLIGWTQVASAQAAVLDTGIGLLLSSLQMAGTECTILFVSLNGYPLGEHQVVGFPNAPLQETTLHSVGICTEVPIDPAPGTRSPDIVELSAIGRLLQRQRQGSQEHLLDARSVLKASAEYQFSLAADEKLATSDLATTPVGEIAYWARTPAWSCHINGPQERLYAMPDDKWETNDVANRMIPAVDAIRSEASRRLAALGMNQAVEPCSLDEILTSLNR